MLPSWPTILCGGKSVQNSGKPGLSETRVRITILAALNKSFGEWSEVFPNAACVVALIDRLVHHAEIISIKGESYRHKEAQERAEAKTKKRKVARSKS